MRFEIPLTAEQYQKVRAKFYSEEFKCSGCGEVIPRGGQKVLFAQPKVANEWGTQRVLVINATCSTCARAFAEFMKSRKPSAGEGHEVQELRKALKALSAQSKEGA